MTRLGDYISEFSVKNHLDESIPVYSVTNDRGFCSGYFNKDVASKDKTTYKIVPRGYFAYNPSRINVGSIAWQNSAERVIVSPLYVVFKVSDKLDRQYLLHYLKSDVGMTFIKAHAAGSVRDSLKFSDLKELPIHVVPLEKQRKIARTLDKLDALISQCHQQANSFDTLVKSQFVEMFGDPEQNPLEWPIKKLAAVVSSITAGWSANGEARPRKAGEKAVLKVSAVTQGFFKPDEYKVIPADLEIKKYVYPKKGDLLFSRANTRELVGATAVIEEDYPELLLPDKLWKVLFTNEMDVYYAKHILSTHAIRKVFSSQSTGTSGSMYNVSAEKFRETLIPVPPIMLQREFAAFVAQVDKSKVEIQKAIDQLEILKKSLMQQYFG